MNPSTSAIVFSPQREATSFPGVVAEVREDQALVSLAQPYVDETGGSQDEVWAPLSQLQKVLDDADNTPQLSG